MHTFRIGSLQNHNYKIYMKALITFHNRIAFPFDIPHSRAEGLSSKVLRQTLIEVVFCLFSKLTSIPSSLEFMAKKRA